MTHTQADLLAHTDRWRGATLTTNDGEASPVMAITSRRCCGAIKIRTREHWLEVPSLAWVEGNPATDTLLTIRAPSGLIGILEVS